VASFFPPDEAERRYEIGVGSLMWGSDYPHIEGTWPHTEGKLKESFAGIPRDEVEAIVGGNAVRVYGFDRATLDGVASRIGPPRASLGI